MTFIHILDLIGVVIFAAYGAHRAIVAKFDVFGALACGALTAVGGGTIRECILGGSPAYLSDLSYPIAIALGVAIALVIHDYFGKLEIYLLTIDAIGVAVFAYIGAQRADMVHLNIIMMIFFAILTAVGGGILTDVITRHRPEALYKEFYPLAAIVLALIAFAFLVRVASIRFRIKLWQPYERPLVLSPRRREVLAEPEVA